MSRTATSVLGSTVITSLLFASLAFAQTGAPASTATGETDSAARKGNYDLKPAKGRAGEQVNGECVATAVGVREDALIAAHSAQNTAIGAALAARKGDLQAAWKMTDNKARRVAREAAWKKFREARAAANKTMKTAVNAAYSAFNTATKACGVQYKEQPEGGATVSL